MKNEDSQSAADLIASGLSVYRPPAHDTGDVDWPLVPPLSHDNIVEAMREGLSLERFETLARDLGATLEQLRVLTGASTPTIEGLVDTADLACSLDERIHGAAVDRLLELEQTVKLAHVVFGTNETGRIWFGSHLGALGYERPLDWLATQPGRERVIEVLYAVKFGFCA